MSSNFAINNVWVQFLSFGGKLGVNCFIMISGYFLINSSFKFKKLIKLVCQVWFYSAVIYLIFLIHDNPNMREFLWKKLFKCRHLLNNSHFILYSIIIIISVFVVCSIIDELRILFIEKYFLRLLDNFKNYRIYNELIETKNNINRNVSSVCMHLNGKKESK